MQQRPEGDAIKTFIAKYKVPILIGLGVAVVVMMTEQQQQPQQQPYAQGGAAPASDTGGGGGGFDMGQWREEQREDDRRQRDRIDSIREVERCYDPNTGREYEVSIHVGC